jgi:hypothetical protein
MGVVLSKAERAFLLKVKAGKASDINANYRRVLKHKILKKRRDLTDDLLLINEVLDKLQEL